MAYVALYRKYRSQSFGELMGQEHVTRTLQNAIKTEHIGHAYLFYGARGCGKTSTARLLARALNCVAQDGPTPEPCGVCRLCVSIRDGACMDVIEMDAASETGIDDVREKIIENAKYAPGEARYKVYIIDEVHDLSAKAFDALLKTLEEPPPHVIFILATTEQHKVPITIRSRCQPYHFKRGTLQDLAKSVQRVIDAEECTAEPEAIQALARSAEGSWRDALSLLEQVLAYSDGHITAQTVHQAIGTVGTETLARVTATLARGCWDETLGMAGELIDSGKDVRQLLTALSGHLRDLMLVSAGATQAAAQELGADRLALLTPQSALFSPRMLLAMMGVLSQAEREIRFTNQHRWLLESTLLRLMPVNLEAAAEAPPAIQARSSTPPQLPATAPLAATPSVIPKPPVTLPSQTPEPAFITEAEEEDSEEAELQASVVEAVQERVGEIPAQVRAPSAPEYPKTPVQEPQNTSTPAAHRFADEMTLDVLRRAWPRVLQLFKKASPSGIAFLENAEVTGLEGRFVVLTFTDSFARDRIQNNSKGREKVEQIINQVLNVEGYKVRCELDRGDEGGAGIPVNNGPKNPSPVVEMATLLDTPQTLPTGPTRIADFDMPTPVPARPAASYQNMVAETFTPSVSPPAPEPSAPVSNGLLAEALDIFGGEVVSSEPIR